MNHAYRLVWSHTTQTFVPAPETAKARGKCGGGRGTVLVLTTAAVLGAGMVHAGPSGGVVSSGSGTIAQSGSTTTIRQGSQNLAINWASFNVAGGERVSFVQPNASAIALNRVLGSGASSIDGTVSANGQVWILNPNGVLFGNHAQVSVGGLVASTLSLNDADFVAGQRTFSAKGSQGGLTNQGSLTGGYVALLGKQVSNEGRISSPNGSTVLAAGDRITLDFGGNRLLSVQVDAGTLNALAQNKGLIHADNGTVILSAWAKDALLNTVVNNEGVIEARGLDTSGGTIKLLGGMNGGTVQVAGTLDASASGSGAGGFIETSGAHVQVAAEAKVSTQAASGLMGTWLIDPTDFTISSGSAAQSNSGIGATTLSNNLATTSVTLATDASTGTDNGDINVNAAVSWSANTTLTLNAYHNINLNAAITATGTTAGLVLNSGNYAAAGSATAGTDYLVAAPVTLSGSNASLSINGTAYTLIHSMADLTAIDSTGDAGSYALAQDLDASGTTYATALVGSSTPFTGTFAGLGHTVSNLAISASLTNDIGLFGVNSGTLRDIGVVNAVVAGASHVGGLVGSNNYGSISNAYATGSVSGSNYVGGLAGYNSGSISNAYATGSVSGSSNVGGLVGYNDGSISNAYATGSVSGSSNYVGGLVGTNSNSISNAYATGSVSGSGGVGGLVGGNFGGVISNAYATGSVSGSSYVGGLVGGNFGGISNAYATGSVSGSSNYVGGLVGINYGSISNTYVTGSVSGSSYVGGLVGQNKGPISASLWLSANAAAGTGFNSGTVDGLTRGLSSTEANSLATYTAAGWNIDALGGTGAVWRIYDGDTMPLLRSFLTPITVSATGVTGKTYDRTVAAASTGYTQSDASATLLGSGLSYASTSANAGSYSSAAGTLLLSGLYSSQQGYDISYANVSLTVTPATLTASGASAANKVYDATTVATVAGGSLSGVIGGDTVTLSQSGTFDNKNVGTGKTVTFSLSGADAGNYVLAGSTATTTANISAATLTASGASAANKTYDATTAATVTGGSLSGVLSGDTVTLSQSGTFDNKNVGTGKTVTFSLSGADAGNYILASSSATTTANITAATLTASGASAANKVYDATTLAAVTGGSLSGVLSGDSVTLSESGTFNNKNVGTGKTVAETFSLGGIDASNYVLASSSATTTANITAATLTANGAGAASKTYDATTVVTVTGGSLSGVIGGDTVTLSQSGTFDNKNVGTGKTVTETFGISGADAGNYVLASSSATTTANITAATLTASGASAANKTYDATTVATVTGGSLSGVISGDTVTLSESGTFSDKNVGTAKTVTETFGTSGADAGNYVLASSSATTTANITAATVTANGAGAASKTYDATTVVTVTGGSLSGVIGGDTVTLSQSGTFDNKNVGTGKTVTETFSLRGIDANNYVLASSSATTTANITAATLTANGASAANKTYDATTVAAVTGGSLSGVIGSDTVTLSQSGTFDNKNEGTGKTVTETFSLSGIDAGNYVLAGSSATTTANISAATVTASGASVANKTYDATTVATVTGGSLSGVIGGDTVTLSQSGTFDNKNVGTGKTVTETFGISGADAGNYVLASSTGTTTANITAATLTASGASAANKTYDTTTAATVTGGSLSGVLSGDTVTLSESGTFNNKNVGTGKTVTETFGTSGADASNYVLANSSATTTANITAATLTANGASAANKTYDATTAATVTGGSLSGVLSGDTVTLSQSGTFDNKNVGTGKTVTFSLSGADAGNYVLAGSTATTTANITAATLTANGASAANKTYDATTAATVTGGSLSGVLSGDSVTLSESGTFNNKNVGTAKTVTETFGTSGADAGNYVLASSSATTTANITAATLTASGSSAASKTYDATTLAAVTGGSLSGVLAGDTVTLGQSGTFNSKNAGTGKTVTETFSLGGVDAGNYVLSSSTGTTTANIAAATVTASGASAANKTYDGTMAATVTGGSLSGVFSGDTVRLNQSGLFSDQNVGAGKTVTETFSLGGTDAGNYVLARSSATSTANISPAALTITANNDTKIAGGIPYSGGNGVSESGFVAGEDSRVLTGSLSYGGSAQGASQAGHYNIVAGGLSAQNYAITYVDGTLVIRNLTDSRVTDALTDLYYTPLLSSNDTPGSDANAGSGNTRGSHTNSSVALSTRGGVPLLSIAHCGVRLDPAQSCALND